MDRFCAPLQQLIDEHISLRAKMDPFYDIIEEIEFESESTTVIHLFAKLHDQILNFNDYLKAHSNREDEGLFPMMERHLEGNDRTIEIMEFEHEKTERHLLDFLNGANQAGANLDENEARTIAVFAVQAHTTLTQHFAKEENVLFPLAERILTMEEKEELERLLLVL